MWPFWLMFLIPAIGILAHRRLPVEQARLMWWGVGALYALLIGLRHEVGGDWFNYLPHFQHAAGLRIAEAAAMGDPGHYLLNWLVAELGGNIYAVNLIYASILMVGTVVFCRRQPNPWLALLVAVPYMLIVVGMGYTRQSVALGFALMGLVALRDQRIWTFVACVALGAVFHKSAVLLLPIAILASSRNRWLSMAMIALSMVLMYFLLLADSAEALWTNYVEADMQSQGGAIRVVMNALPAVLLILFQERMVPNAQERRLWLCLAAFALICVPLVGFASTAVDRVALYLIPLQLYVFARLPRLAGSTMVRTALIIAIVGYYGAVQFVWLNFATHAPYWVPYRIMPLT